MNYIDVKNFRKYEQLFGDNGPAKIGHVNAVIKGLNEAIANIPTGGSYLYAGNSSTVTNINWSQATLQELNLDNNPTLTFTGGVAGTQTNLLLKQTLLGQRSITWPSNVLWNNGSTPSLPTLSNVANAGGIDSTFVSGTGFNFSTNAVAVQSDGKVLVGGSFTSYNGTVTPSFVRINSDGTLDTAFNSNIGTGPDNSVNKIVIQPDGKIIVAGGFFNWNGSPKSGIVRLNANGTVDNTFSIGTGITRGGMSIFPEVLVLQADGKVIVGGVFLEYNGTSVVNIVRINSDGSIDSTFNSNVGTGPTQFGGIAGVGVQSDGKIVIQGGFNSWNGFSYNAIVRLNADGTIDGTFNVGTGLGSYFYNGPGAVAIQSDDKILIGARFSDYNGNSSTNLVRINTDGSYDSTFTVGVGFNNGVRSLQIQSDGKIICTGVFTSYNGVSNINRIVRLNTDGTRDSTFDIGTGFQAGFDSQVNDSFLAYPHILCVGNFFAYNGTTQGYISKLGLASIPPATTYTKVSFEYNGTDYIASI